MRSICLSRSLTLEISIKDHTFLVSQKHYVYAMYTSATHHWVGRGITALLCIWPNWKQIHSIHFNEVGLGLYCRLWFCCSSSSGHWENPVLIIPPWEEAVALLHHLLFLGGRAPQINTGFLFTCFNPENKEQACWPSWVLRLIHCLFDLCNCKAELLKTRINESISVGRISWFTAATRLFTSWSRCIFTPSDMWVLMLKKKSGKENLKLILPLVPFHSWEFLLTAASAYVHRLTACVLCLAVAQTNQELHQGGLHGEDRPKGNASVCRVCKSKLFLLLL